MTEPDASGSARAKDRGAASGGHNTALESLRGIAALMVVIVHLNAFEFTSLPLAVAQPGALGVDIFFCLSGFLIARCVLVPPDFHGRRYFLNRVRRILPNYLICLFVILTLADARPLLQAGTGQLIGDIVTHLTLTHGWFDAFATSIVGPMWTLSHEWWFYMFMLAAAGWMRSPRWPIVIGAMVLVSLVARLGLAENWWRLPTMWNHPLCRFDQFAFGMTGAIAVRALEGRSTKRLDAALVAGGLTCVAAAFLWCHHVAAAIDLDRFRGINFGQGVMDRFAASTTRALLFHPLLASGVAVLIVGLWRLPGSFNRVLQRTPLPWMGRVSYSTYLWHLPIIQCLGRAVRRLPPESPWNAPGSLAVLAFALIYGFSAFAWHAFELPWLRRSPRAAAS